MEFASPFDEQLAHAGPAAIFLRDHKGRWRVIPEWTRDCWGRAEAPHPFAWTWLLARDLASGFVQIVLCTSPSLLREHPRLQLREVPDLATAEAELRALGIPTLAPEPW